MTAFFDDIQDDRLITVMAMMEAIDDAAVRTPIWSQMREGYGTMETRDQVKYNVDHIRDILAYVESLYDDAFDNFWRRDGIELHAWDFEIIPFLLRYFFIRRTVVLSLNNYAMITIHPDWRDMIGYLDLHGLAAFEQHYITPNFH